MLYISILAMIGHPKIRTCPPFFRQPLKKAHLHKGAYEARKLGKHPPRVKTSGGRMSGPSIRLHGENNRFLGVDMVGQADYKTPPLTGSPFTGENVSGAEPSENSN
jgi:hypothetical protein